jgi:hypothetical protein
MPYKSRRNRRSIPQSRTTSSAPASAAGAGTKASANQPVKSSSFSAPAPRTAMGPEATYPYISNELKWIAVVTVITAVVLVVAYYIFR